MKISWTTHALHLTRADALLLPVVEGPDDLGETFTALDEALGGWPRRIATNEGFTGKSGRLLAMPTPTDVRADRIVLLGLGRADDLSSATVRKVYAKAVRTFRRGALTVATTLPPGPIDETTAAIVEGLGLASYSFDRYRKPNGDGPARIERVVLCDGRPTARRERSVDEALALVEGTLLARDLVNEPPVDLNPAALARHARRIAKDHGLGVRVMGREELKRRKMGGILGVSMGSAAEPRLIHLDYKPAGRVRRKIALVGKGITFDSGGISLKPPPSMVTMKCDMAGAAAVLGAMQVIGALAPRGVRVHGLVPAAENMPGPAALRPGDVLTTSLGKTVEVLNTDAEGRLVLADALAYAERDLGVDEIIDLATLTGACMVALGTDVAALYARDRALGQALLDAAEQEGEPLWEMPLFESYRKELKSDIADLKNVGGRFAGSITAALFLGEFVSLKRWAHLDIAGPAFAESQPDLGPKGGTGFGVRTLARYVLDDARSLAHKQ